MNPTVFGIGNPLIDVILHAQDADLETLGIDKGIMQLVTEERQKEILAHFDGAERVFRPGGSAPNTIIALAGLGVPAAISGIIGDDDFGHTYEEQVLSFSVASRLTANAGMTGSCVVLVTPDGERSMNTNLGLCQTFSSDALDEDLLRKSRFLYFTGYMWDTDLQKAAITRAIEVAKEEGIEVVFDVADPFAVDRYREDFIHLIKHKADVVFANHREAQILFGCKSADDCVRILGEHAKLAAMKIGKDGSLVIENGRVEHAESSPIPALDSTGAGDMYAAGFLAAHAAGRSALACAQAGGYLAEEIIQQIGAQFTFEDFERIKASLKGLVA